MIVRDTYDDDDSILLDLPITTTIKEVVQLTLEKSGKNISLEKHYVYCRGKKCPPDATLKGLGIKPNNTLLLRYAILGLCRCQPAKLA